MLPLVKFIEKNRPTSQQSSQYFFFATLVQLKVVHCRAIDYLNLPSRVCALECCCHYWSLFSSPLFIISLPCLYAIHFQFRPSPPSIRIRHFYYVLPMKPHRKSCCIFNPPPLYHGGAVQNSIGPFQMPIGSQQPLCTYGWVDMHKRTLHSL